MKKVTELRSRSLRKDRNTELVRRMRSGESLSSFNSFSSWFPPRPVIEKDATALQKLYGHDAVSLSELGDGSGQAGHGFKPLRLA